jgi:hypothetical protein
MNSAIRMPGLRPGGTGHESREPFVEFHGFQSLGRCLTEGIEVRPELYCQAINLWRFVSNVERDGLSIQPGRDLASLRCTNR